MADSTPEGSPTPRKVPVDGGVFLNKSRQETGRSSPLEQAERLTASDDDGGDSTHQSFDRRIANTTSTPKRKKPPKLSLPTSAIGLDPTDRDLAVHNFDYSSAARYTNETRSRRSYDSSENTASSTDTSYPRSFPMSLESSTDSFDPHRSSSSTTPNSEDARQMQALSRRLDCARMDSVDEQTDELERWSGQDYGYTPPASFDYGLRIGSESFHPDFKPQEHEFAQSVPSTTIFTPAAIFTSSSASSPPASSPWNQPARGHPTLMHSSIPDTGGQSAPLPQVPLSGPGIIGQPSTTSPFQHHLGGQYQSFESAPHTSPLPQGHPPRFPKGGSRGRRFGWMGSAAHALENRSGPGYESGPTSRSMTPISPYGSNPSMNSSMVSLAGSSQAYAHSNLRSQSSSNLNAAAAEFNGATHGFMGPSPWNDRPRDSYSQNYVMANEPLNYRRLAEKNMSTDWKLVVDKIVCGNDQQASLFLQQKIKNGDPDQKQEIIELIISQGVPLMANRFGNFLIQRCMEHGTPENISDIGERILGNTVNLSMDAFGCHVVQKAFDYASDRQKRIMVHELVGSVQTTIIHRYACHVWQKLFELSWDGPRPPIMRFVNESLKGMWHEVALGETGSLVVQNIFENCSEHEKRPCIEEVLQQISSITTGQFGNWCIQHICEHGAIPDKSRAIDHILMFATIYSKDQFASKVVEKCLKVCGTEFLDRYLERVCAYRQDVPRMDLIDIAGDQYGNYLIQYVLQHADSSRKDIVASHVRRHMVSLRGSKYGSRVAMQCTSGGHSHRFNHGNSTVYRAPGGAIGETFQRTGPWGLPRQGGYRGNY